jgi:hypothetical protein
MRRSARSSPSQIYRLERVAGCGIIAPRRSNSAHLHRPWRATSDTAWYARARCRRLRAPVPKPIVGLCPLTKGGPATPFGTSAGRHGDGPVVEWIIDIRQALILTRRGPVELCRALHVESLVGTFVVVAIDELTKLRPLLEEVAGRRLLEARLEKAG